MRYRILVLSAARSNPSFVARIDAIEPPDEYGGQPDYLDRNREAWDRWAPSYLAAGRRAWTAKELRWGIWAIPESTLGLTRVIKPDSDVIELGCGTAAVSAWLAREGARPVAVDISKKQVRSVEALQADVGPHFPVVCGNAEDVPFDHTSFDAAISEYGASLWCDPNRWLAEAHRLLRPNGRLIFFTNSSQLMMCTPDDGGVASDRLVRDYFGPARVEFDDGGPVEFHPTHGDWIRLLGTNGFTLEDLVEVRPPVGSVAQFTLASLDWARRWPSEEIWIARKAERTLATKELAHTSPVIRLGS